MSKLFTVAFCVLLVCSMALKRKKVDENCDAFHWCEKGLKCVNYVCVVGVEDKLKEKVEWVPKGPKCAVELAKYCPRNYYCEDHRCYSAYLDHPMYDPEIPDSEILQKVVEREELRQALLKQQQQKQQNLKQQSTQQVKQQQINANTQ